MLRLRPIMMTMLVATLGLLPAAAVARHRLRFAAALRHRDCGRTDGRAVPSLVLLPTLYADMAGPTDVLPPDEEDISE